MLVVTSSKFRVLQKNLLKGLVIMYAITQTLGQLRLPLRSSPLKDEAGLCRIEWDFLLFDFLQDAMGSHLKFNQVCNQFFRVHVFDQLHAHVVSCFDRGQVYNNDGGSSGESGRSGFASSDIWGERGGAELRKQGDVPILGVPASGPGWIAKVQIHSPNLIRFASLWFTRVFWLSGLEFIDVDVGIPG